MDNNDYGFQPTGEVQQVRKDAHRPAPGELIDDRQASREEANASWWLQQLQHQLKRYMMSPTPDRKSTLDTLMADYAKQVEAGTVRKPHFSLD